MVVTSESEYDKDYQRYLRRCAAAAPPRQPLARVEFDVLSRRLDDLSILKLERRLTSREHCTLVELSVQLCDDVVDSLFDAGGPLADDGGEGTLWQLRRRAAWRQRRRRR
jgi:hypothetical protein